MKSLMHMKLYGYLFINSLIDLQAKPASFTPVDETTL